MSEPEPATTARRLGEADVQRAADVIRARQQVRHARRECHRLAGHDLQFATVHLTTAKGPVQGTITGPKVGSVLAALHAAFEAEEVGMTLGLEAMGITADAEESEAASHTAEGGAVADPS
jgi:hypothetical protein